jgi:hypothetical protein
MKKEIIIAAHREKITWLPSDWKSITTVYRCGDPVEIPLRFTVNKPNNHFNNHFNNHSFDHDHMSFRNKDRIQVDSALVDQIRNIRELSIIVKDIYDVFNEQNGVNNNYAEKQMTNCPNGREAQQWLNHIILRYNCLADMNVFLQAYPFDHSPKIESLVNKIDTIKNFSFCTLPQNIIDDKGFSISSLGKDTYKMCKNFWTIDLKQKMPKKIIWSAGAQFAISKQNILKKPLSWYLEVREMSMQTSRSGEILERLWWHIFDCPTVTNGVI